MNLRHTPRGITLIELTVYIAVLALVTNLIMTIFLKSELINHLGNKYIFSLREASQDEAAIKNDLREAVGIMPSLNEYQTSNSTIILKTFKSYDLADGYNYIIYQKNPETNRLNRITLTESKDDSGKISATEGSRKSLGPELREFKFIYDKEDMSRVRLVTVSMILNKPGSRQIEETTFNFLVNLRTLQD